MIKNSYVPEERGLFFRGLCSREHKCAGNRLVVLHKKEVKWMKKMYLAALVVMAVLIAIPSVAQAGLLNNGDFEIDGPVDWYSGGTGGSGGQWYWDHDSKSPTHCVAAGFWGADNTGYWGQNVSGISEGLAYDFTAWSKTEDGFIGDVYLKTEFMNVDDTVLRTDVALGTVSTTYSQLQLITGTAPTGTTQANFLMYAEGSANSAIFDDANVDVVPEPSSLLLLLSGIAGLFVVSRRKR